MHKGICHLCGLFTELSFEHVPPASAFQQAFGNEKTYLHNFVDIYSGKKVRPQQKGSGKYTLCKTCNNNTGSWYAPSYLTLVSETLYQITENQNTKHIQIQQRNYPLRIIKQILTMFFSINGDNFQKANKNLKDFVLRKGSTNLSNEYRILAFSYLDKQHQLMMGVSGSIEDNIVFSTLSFFPLAFVLCFDEIPAWGRDAEDIYSFSQYGYETEEFLSFKLIPYSGPGKNELFVKKNS